MSRVAIFVLGVMIVGFPANVRGQANLPIEAQGYLEFLVGKWDFTNLQGQQGTTTIEWAPGKQCVICNAEAPDSKSTAIVGWDPQEKVIFETWYKSDGERYENRITDFSKKGWHFEATIHSPTAPPRTLTLDVEISTDQKSFSAVTKDGKTITYRRRS